MAPDVNAREKSLLNFRFERFSATNTTLKDAGALLAGYIMTGAGGAKGFVSDSISNPSSEKVTITAKGATTIEIANRIVLAKSKGAWVFRPTAGSALNSGADTPIQVFGYADDAEELEKISCKP